MDRTKRVATLQSPARLVKLAEQVERILRSGFPGAYCKVLYAPDHRLRILIVDEQFNGVETLAKMKQVVERLTRPKSGLRGLSEEEMEAISSINGYGPAELV